jgi:ribokinase
MDVVSLGSVNVDRVAYVDDATLSSLAATGDWFPAPGETVRVAAERVPSVDRHRSATFLGGKGANQAVAAAAAGAEAALLGAVGADAGRFDVRSTLRERGVAVDGLATADAPTGTAYVFVAPDGENHIAVVPGANAAVDAGYVREHMATVRGADALLLQNEVPVEAAETALCGLAGCDPADRPTVVLDPSPPAGVEPLLASPRVDYATPNESEAAALSGPLADFGGTVVATHGGDPVVVDGADRFEVPPPGVDPVDTTGAGDVFAGYLAARLGAGDDLRSAVAVAAAAGAVSTEREGVQPAVPDPGAVRRRLEG